MSEAQIAYQLDGCEACGDYPADNGQHCWETHLNGLSSILKARDVELAAAREEIYAVRQSDRVMAGMFTDERNELNTAQAEVARLTARAQELEEALVRYAEHDVKCWYPYYLCNCGLANVVRLADHARRTSGE